MIIHPQTPKIENGEITVSAGIELQKPPYDFPKTLWFRFPEAQAEFVSERADGFAVALLNLALLRGEDIQLRGTLSPRLAWGMQEFQRVQSLWHPHEKKPVTICADDYARTEPGAGKIGCAFSGGVDSFFTLWTHLPQNEPYRGNAVSYGLFVQGLDIGLHETHTFETHRTAYAKILREWGVELLTARTNIRAFDQAGDWVYAITPALASVVHLLGRGLGRFYIPASEFYAEQPPWGPDAFLSALLSSEEVQILEDGAGFDKYEKIEAVARIPASYDCLRVCYQDASGLVNCGKCDKCVHTMTSLALCGALPKYSTFPKPLTRRKILFSKTPYTMLAIELSTLNAALRAHRYDYASGISFKLFWNSLRWGSSWLRKRMGLM